MLVPVVFDGTWYGGREKQRLYYAKGFFTRERIFIIEAINMNNVSNGASVWGVN